MYGEIVASIPGLVCKSCGIGIKIHLFNTKKVNKVTFDINKQLAFISTIEGKILTTGEIRTAIENAGFSVNSIKQSNE